MLLMHILMRIFYLQNRMILLVAWIHQLVCGFALTFYKNIGMNVD